MFIKSTYKKCLIAVLFSAGSLMATSSNAQNASDIAKVTNGGTCGEQYDGSDKCDVTGADFSDQRITGWYRSLQASGANFSRTQLFAGDFFKANLAGADFSYANISGFEFNSTNLTGAKFVGARIASPFEGANMTSADLTDASISDMDNFLKYGHFCQTTMPDRTVNNRDC
ncbi:MAG: pentapeptide repeat-containing protein [Nitratireductor sp.]